MTAASTGAGRPAVVTVVGARPQFVKAAVVSEALRAEGALEEVLVHTGQHYDVAMSDVFFAELGLPAPRHHLGIGGGTHGAQTGRMLAALEEVLLAERPAAVLVYGDTNSTLAGALAAAKLHVPVAHVEAGLRSFNRRMPEEVNRVLTDHVADLLFAPTEAAVANLEREGLPAERVVRVGDVMLDAALRLGAAAEARSDVLARLGLAPRGYVLATVHRQENTDDARRLEAILGALADVAEAGTPVVLPLHPRTRARLDARAAAGPARALPAGLRLVDPVGYLDMLMLERHARVIATDSGGVQKEAYFFRVPCVTLRDETEWVELVDAGWNVLAPPTGRAAVAAAVAAALADGAARPHPPLYGDGHAATSIARALAARYASAGAGAA